MIRRCEARVAAIVAMSAAEVKMLWEQELARNLTHALQVAAHGGLDRRLARHLDRLCRDAEQAGRAASTAPPPSDPGAGVMLLREWNGKTHKVIVAGDGG